MFHCLGIWNRSCKQRLHLLFAASIRLKLLYSNLFPHSINKIKRNANKVRRFDASLRERNVYPRGRSVRFPCDFKYASYCSPSSRLHFNETRLYCASWSIAGIAAFKLNAFMFVKHFADSMALRRIRRYRCAVKFLVAVCSAVILETYASHLDQATCHSCETSHFHEYSCADELRIDSYYWCYLDKRMDITLHSIFNFHFYEDKTQQIKKSNKYREFLTYL